MELDLASSGEGCCGNRDGSYSVPELRLSKAEVPFPQVSSSGCGGLLVEAHLRAGLCEGSALLRITQAEFVSLLSIP